MDGEVVRQNVYMVLHGERVSGRPPINWDEQTFISKK